MSRSASDETSFMSLLPVFDHIKKSRCIIHQNYMICIYGKYLVLTNSLRLLDLPPLL